MSAGSVSRIELKVEIKDKSQLKCELKRHLAPKTVGTIIRSLPLEGNIHVMGNSFVYIETKIKVGGERQRSRFTKGDVSFMTSTGSVCLFLKDVESTKAMTPIGTIISNADSLNSIKSGDVCVITHAEV